MYCENCGNQIKDGALFCNKCGTKVDYSEDESVVQEQHSQQHTLESNSSVYVEVQKKRKVWPIWIGVITGVVVIAAVIAFFLIFNGQKTADNFMFLEDQLTIYNSKDFDGKSYELNLLDKNGEVHSISSEVNGLFWMSMDRQSMLAYNENEVVYYNHGQFMPCDKHSFAWVSMSPDGSSVFAAENNDDGQSYLYKYPFNPEDVIFSAPRIDSLTSSVSGKYICVTVEESKDNYVHYLINTETGESEKINENLYWVTSVSETGKTVYCYCENGLSIYKDGKLEQLSDDPSTGQIGKYFNYDSTQLFFVANNKTYLFDETNGLRQICDSWTYVLLPEYIQHYSMAADSWDHTYGIRDFRDLFLVEERDNQITGAVYYLDSDLTCNEVTHNVKRSKVSNDGKTLVYLSSDGIVYSTKIGSKDSQGKIMVNPEEIGEAKSFVVSPDCRKVFLLQDNGDLYHNGILIDTGIDDTSFYGGVFSDNYLIYLKNGQAYVTDGGKPNQITNSNDGWVKSAYAGLYYPVFYQETNGVTTQMAYIGNKTIELDKY